MGNSRKLISLWTSIFVLGAGLTLSGCDGQQEDENAEGKTSGPNAHANEHNLWKDIGRDHGQLSLALSVHLTGRGTKDHLA